MNVWRQLPRAIKSYLVVGSSVYLLELAIILTAQASGASSLVAVGLSFWIGLMISFVLQKFITFGDKRTHHRLVIAQLLAVTGLVIFNFGFTLVVTKLLSSLMPAVVCRTLAIGITTLWNFYLYKTRIFKQSEASLGRDLV